MIGLLLRVFDLDELYALGLKGLRMGRYKRVVSIAREAKRRHNTMAYELEARALWGLGERQRALELIFKGARKHPSVSILWEYAGEFASDLGQYDDATAAFMRAGGSRLGRLQRRL